MYGKAKYTRPTSLLIPVGYNSKKVLYLNSKLDINEIAMYNSTTSTDEYRSKLLYLSHMSHEGAKPSTSFTPKKEYRIICTVKNEKNF